MSFEEFVQGASPRLFRTALLLTGHDRAAAEDLLQIALERAYRHWARICRSEEPERLQTLSDRSALLRGVTTRPEAPAPATMPRGQVYGCDSQTYGALQSDWRRFAVHAGPLWILNRGIGPGFSFHNPDGTLKAVPLIVLLQDNVTVSVETTAAGQPYFRFLAGFNATDEYTLSDGLPSTTFSACSAQAALFGEGLTEYYLGIIVAGPRCITLDVRTSASQPAAPRSSS